MTLKRSLEEVALPIKACLFGGAIGDALGAPVEFIKLPEIHRRFGAEGIQDFAAAYGRDVAITDDTQMTLFTAEGTVRAYMRATERESCHFPSIIHNAYLRWLLTQGITPTAKAATLGSWPDGWLIQERALFSKRGPGNTCLTALSAPKLLGKSAENNSKGCGTVMRVAPIGLAMTSDQAYDLGARTSALTHGHPTAIISGGAFALIIALLLEGGTLPGAIAQARVSVAKQAHSAETLHAIDSALKLAASGDAPTPEKVETLGAAWVAEEALAISLYCALVARSFEHGVLLAVNHSGDSDSTGSMAGQLLGLTYGFAAIPSSWKERVELREIIETIASDLAGVRALTLELEPNRKRYPIW